MSPLGSECQAFQRLLCLRHIVLVCLYISLIQLQGQICGVFLDLCLSADAIKRKVQIKAKFLGIW